MSSTLDFLEVLDRGQQFKDLLNNNFDFSLFKVRIPPPYSNPSRCPLIVILIIHSLCTDYIYIVH